VAGSQGWDDRPVPGARLAAFWLAYGRSDDVVLTTLMRDLALDEDAALQAVEQAQGWLSRPET
jgi:hypothetical protein